DGGFVTTASLRSAARTSVEEEGGALSWFLHRWPRPTFSTKQKTTAIAVVFAWWGMVDSDHRSQ
ncbi:MAG: hypothetical protein IKM33_01285, partial [Clostridia bacterium]|nr:hypothetical protein [Clostridia bacterium]